MAHGARARAQPDHIAGRCAFKALKAFKAFKAFKTFKTFKAHSGSLSRMQEHRGTGARERVLRGHRAARQLGGGWMVSQMASSLRGTRARIHVWIPSVSVLFVVALCLCTLLASIRDDSIGLLLMPIACALVCAGCRMRRLINTWMRRLMNTRGGSTGSRPTSPASLQAQQAYKPGKMQNGTVKVWAGCRMRRLVNTCGGSTGSRPTSPASLQAQLQGVQILQEGTGERRDCSANGVPICKT